MADRVIRVTSDRQWAAIVTASALGRLRTIAVLDRQHDDQETGRG